MFLSRLILNPYSRQVRKDIDDVYNLHRSIMSGFGDINGRTTGNARQQLGILHRLEIDSRRRQIVLLVQSEALPDWSGLADDYLLTDVELPNPDMKDVGAIYGGLPEGQVVLFRMRANPTRRIRKETGPTGKVWDGKRVGLTTDEQRTAWLVRKGDQHGFRLLPLIEEPSLPDVRVVPERKRTGSGRKTFWPVMYEGHLQVTEKDRFVDAIRQGIGPAKSFGFGLLSIAPARR